MGLDGTTVDETSGSAAFFRFVVLALSRVGATALMTAARTSKTGATFASSDSGEPDIQVVFNVLIQPRGAVVVSPFVVRAVLCLQESLAGWHAGLQEWTLLQYDSVRQCQITRLGRHRSIAHVVQFEYPNVKNIIILAVRS